MRRRGLPQTLVDLVAALLVVQPSAEGVRGRRAWGATEDLPQLSSGSAGYRVGRQAARLREGSVERQSGGRRVFQSQPNSAWES